MNLFTDLAKVILATAILLITVSGVLIVKAIISQEGTVNTASYRMTTNGKTTDIYLTSRINAPDNYLRIFQLLQEAKKGDIINFYLAGNGGYVTTANRLLVLIKSSNAQVNAIVYGPVYSAHAVLATNMHTMKLKNRHIFFMFHRMAAGNEALLLPTLCKRIPESRKDRGISARQKCLEFAEKFEHYGNVLVYNTLHKVLTAKQLKAYESGHDVLVDGIEVKRRLK